LFFRYHAASKVIVFAWVHDEQTKRSYDSKEEAWIVFRHRLKTGHPPDDWNHLLRASQSVNLAAASAPDSSGSSDPKLV
jgi:toxin YhaV